MKGELNEVSRLRNSWGRAFGPGPEKCKIA
jgi:hypothetical protein